MTYTVYLYRRIWGVYHPALVTLHNLNTNKTLGVRTFVTKMAAPVGVTQALPGLHAGAVHTARVRYALVTVLALPAVKAPEKQERVVT